jgi:hypothetical protein
VKWPHKCRWQTRMKTTAVVVSVALPLVCVVLLLVGCAGRRVAAGEARYTIVMVNRTYRNLSGVGVFYGKRMAAFKGPLVKGGRAGYGFVSLPVPEQAQVEWTEVGKPRSVTVKLDGIVPSHPVGMYVFFIIERDGSVTVQVCKNEDLVATSSGLGLRELRETPSTVEDIFYEFSEEPAASTRRLVKKDTSGRTSADGEFDSLIGNLPTTTDAEGSRSATLADGTVVSVHGRKANGRPPGPGVGTIRIKRANGKEFEVIYEVFAH